MSTQLLVNVITATVPAGAVSFPVAHGLTSNQRPVAPTLVLPKAQSTVTVAFVDENNVYLNNPSGASVEVTFRVERGLSNEVDAETLPLFVQSTGDGSGGVTGVDVTAPVTNSGTATAPNIGVSVGSTAGTVCAGDDVRLSNARSPTGAAGGVLYGTYPNPSKLGSPEGTVGIQNTAGMNIITLAPDLSGASTNTFFRVLPAQTTTAKGTSVSIYGGISTVDDGGGVYLYGGSTSAVGKQEGDIWLQGRRLLGNFSGPVCIQTQSSGATANGIFIGTSPGPGTTYIYIGSSVVDNNDVSIVSGALAYNIQVFSVTGTGSTIPSTDSCVVLVSSAPYTLASAPTINTPSYPGVLGSPRPRITLVGGSNHPITLQKDSALGGPLAGSKLALKANTLTINPNEAYDFLWNVNYWIQVG